MKLGRKDILSGDRSDIPVAIISKRSNLAGMASQSIDIGASVLLVSMEIPPNYGSRYTQMFRDSFARVAESTGSTLAPFFLDGVATERELMQADGIHPTPEAQPLLLDNIWPSVEALILDQSARAER